jgi:hypothetical protein
MSTNDLTPEARDALTTLPTAIAELVERARATAIKELALWEQEALRLATGPGVLSGAPWHVALADCSLAIAQTRNAAGQVVLTPVHGEPAGGGILGASCYTRAQAEAVAAARGGGFRPVMIRDVPAIRVKAIRELLVQLNAMQA